MRLCFSPAKHVHPSYILPSAQCYDPCTCEHTKTTAATTAAAAAAKSITAISNNSRAEYSAGRITHAHTSSPIPLMCPSHTKSWLRHRGGWQLAQRSQRRVCSGVEGASRGGHTTRTQAYLLRACIQGAFLQIYCAKPDIHHIYHYCSDNM